MNATRYGGGAIEHDLLFLGNHDHEQRRSAGYSRRPMARGVRAIDQPGSSQPSFSRTAPAARNSLINVSAKRWGGSRKNVALKSR